MEQSSNLVTLLAEAVVALDPNRVQQLCHEALSSGFEPEMLLEMGLAMGMRKVGEKFAAKEYFVPEVLLASRAMYAGFEILKERIPQRTGRLGRVALGVVEGDIHDIGKNIVKVMVEAAGYEVLDLGRNVPVERFVLAVRDGVQALGMSSLMTTTMPNMAKVIETLKKAGLRERVKVLVGGAPVTSSFAQRIGADGYASDAHHAVLEFNRLLG